MKKIRKALEPWADLLVDVIGGLALWPVRRYLDAVAPLPDVWPTHVLWGLVRCHSCDREGIAIQEVVRGEPIAMNLECPKCGKMAATFRGRPAHARNRAHVMEQLRQVSGGG